MAYSINVVIVLQGKDYSYTNIHLCHGLGQVLINTSELEQQTCPSFKKVHQIQTSGESLGWESRWSNQNNQLMHNL